MVAASGAALVAATMLACNALIGLSDPTVRDAGTDGVSPPGADAAADAPMGPTFADGNGLDAFAPLPDVTTPAADVGAGVMDPPVVVIINASRFPGVLFCVSLGQNSGDIHFTGSPQPANIDGGLPSGLGGRGADMAGIQNAWVNVFVIPSANVTPAGATCDVLLGTSGTGGTLGADCGGYPCFFRTAPQFPPGSFSSGSRAVVALTGCPPWLDAGAVSCPPAPASDTLQLVSYLHLTAPDAGTSGMGIVPLEASPALDCYGTSPGCGGKAPMGIYATGAQDASVVLLPPRPADGTPATIGQPPDTNNWSVVVASGTPVLGPQTFPFYVVWADSVANIMPGGNFFTPGSTYIFVAVGDPSLPQDPVSSTPAPSLRVLAYPWDIEAGMY
jgi:hypothetical protein